eukprot:2151681-Ditylum_brightwellii.AAC.1
MHRVKPQGEGRSTKRNLKRKGKVEQAHNSTTKDKGDDNKMDIDATSAADDAEIKGKEGAGDDIGAKKIHKVEGTDNSPDTKKKNPYLSSVSKGNKQTAKDKPQASDILAFRPRGLHLSLIHI